MPKKKEKAKVGFSIDFALLARAKEAAEKEQRSFSNWLCIAIEAALSKGKK